jgi:hypothetical protein
MGKAEAVSTSLPIVRIYKYGSFVRAFGCVPMGQETYYKGVIRSVGF